MTRSSLRSRGRGYRYYRQIPIDRPCFSLPLRIAILCIKTTIAYFCDCVLYDLLVRHIALVAHKQLVDPLGSIAVNFLQPLLDVVERLHICNIVDNTDAVRTAVVGGRDGSEALLPCSIPLLHDHQKVPNDHVASSFSSLTHNLELDSLAIQLDRSDFLSLKSADLLVARLYSHHTASASLQSQHRWLRYSFPCMCHRQTVTGDKTFQRRSHR